MPSTPGQQQTLGQTSVFETSALLYQQQVSPQCRMRTASPAPASFDSLTANLSVAGQSILLSRGLRRLLRRQTPTWPDGPRQMQQSSRSPNRLGSKACCFVLPFSLTPQACVMLQLSAGSDRPRQPAFGRQHVSGYSSRPNVSSKT